jgi:hypothetical protein
VPPPTGQFWVCRKMAHRELASLGVSKTAPGTPQAGPGPRVRCARAPQLVSFGLGAVPRRRLASPAAHAMPPPLPPATPPTAPLPRRPSPHRQLAGAPGASGASPPPRRAGWPASHRPSGRRGSRVVRRAPRPPAQGEGTPARFHRRASRLARGVTSGLPTSHAPAASGPPPQSTLQPGAVGPVASRLTIYSPTPIGWGNGEQALKCPKDFPGGALNYVSGPCRFFFPIQSGPPS